MDSGAYEVKRVLLFLFSFATEAEREKFEHVYEKWRRLMLHKALGILRDAQLAEDAVSEAFLRIYKNLAKIDDPDSGRCASFVVTITKNVALTMLSKGQRTTFEPMEERQVDPFDLEQFTLSEISSERIYDLINGLSEELRSVFLLKYGHGLSHREIADTLKISENNVNVRMHRARKKLAALLREEGYMHEG